jgi:hypothetical protein
VQYETGAEAEDETSRRVSLLSCSVTHHVKTPLNHVLSILPNFSQDDGDEEDFSWDGLAGQVELDIGRLIRLARQLRRPGTELRDARSASFEPKDDYGASLLAKFSQYISNVCDRDLPIARSSAGFVACVYLRLRDESTIVKC